MSRLILITIVVILFSISALAVTVYVPSQYPTIQAGVNASVNGDTVLVADGIYSGTGNINIVLGGRAITVKSENGPSNCIIDCHCFGIGFIFDLYETNATVVEGFTITNGYYSGGISCAGAIDIFDASPTIKNCILNHNITNWDGGGICFESNSQAVIENCVITGNYAQFNGGGIMVNYSSDVVIRYCVISDNNAVDFGDGICLYNNSVADIINCTIAGSGQEDISGIYCSNSLVNLTNTIIYNNELGIDFANANSTVHYCDFYRNNLNFSGSNPVGLGAITTTNQNGTPCDHYYNIFQNPRFVNPAGMIFYLLPGSPCINAGDPQILDPDNTISDIGAYYFFGPVGGNVTVSLSPVNPPIIVPSTGGPVDYNVLLQNDTAGVTRFDSWTMLTYPNGIINGPQILKQNLFLAPGTHLFHSLSFYIPVYAMAGEYTLTGYVGEYPDSAVDSSSFTFTKLPGEDGIVAEDLYPSSLLLHPCSPNPFNSSTDIRFEILDASQIELKIFDISGREIASMVNGQWSMGNHQITWDASGMPSGIYFLKLTTGGETLTEKLLLIK